MLTYKAKWFLKFDNESAVMFMTGCAVSVMSSCHDKDTDRL